MMVFFDTMFFIPQVSRFFVQEGKISMLLFFSLSEIRWWKLLTLCKKNMHSHSVNKFSGVTLWHDFDCNSQSGDNTTKL